MYREDRSNGLIIAVIVLLALVLVCLCVLIGSIALSDRAVDVDAPLPEIPQSSRSEEPALVPESSGSSEESSQTQPQESSSKVETIPYVPPKQQASSGQSSSSSSAQSSSSGTGSSSGGVQKTYSKSGIYDSKQKFSNVLVKTGDLTLENKTVTGDLTITRDAGDTIELINCVIEDTLYIRGGQTVILTDSRVARIVVKEGHGQEVTIVADGDTRCGVVTAYTGVVLDESGLNSGKSGFSEVKVPFGNSIVPITLQDALLTKVTLDEEANLYLNADSVIRRLRVNEPAVIDGTGTIELLTIGSNEIVSYIVPDEEEKASKRYDDVEYRSHAQEIAVPTGLNVTWDGGSFRFGWTAGDANATGYEYSISSSDGVTTRSGAVNTLYVAVDDAFIGQSATFKVRATTTAAGYVSSPWVSLTYTPAQLGGITNFTIASASVSGITLTWEPAANAASYNLTIAPTGGTATDIVGITGSSCTVTSDQINLNDGASYLFTLEAVAAENVKPTVSIASTEFGVKKLTAPAVTAAYADGKVVYSWGAVPGADRYTLSGVAATYTQTADTVSAQMALAENQTGSFALAVKAPGRFDQTAGTLYLDSEEGSAVFTVAQLAVPTGLQIHSVSDHQIQAEWAVVDHADSYQVELSGSATDGKKVDTNVYSYNGTDLLAEGKIYTVSVTAKAPAYVDGPALYLDSASATISYRIENTPAIAALTTTITNGTGSATLTVKWNKEANTVYSASQNGSGTLQASAAGYYTLNIPAGQTGGVTITATKNAAENVYYLPVSSATAAYMVYANHGITDGTSTAVMEDNVLKISNVAVDTTNYTYTLSVRIGGTAQTKTIAYNGQMSILASELFDGSAIPADYTITLAAADKLPDDTAIYLSKTVTLLAVSSAGT